MRDGDRDLGRTSTGLESPTNGLERHVARFAIASFISAV
jgi:hypothetical protein